MLRSNVLHLSVEMVLSIDVVSFSNLRRQAAWTCSSGVNSKRPLYAKPKSEQAQEKRTSQALTSLWGYLQPRVRQFAEDYLDRIFPNQQRR